ncbi:MAG: hypothetical protein GY869_32420 [Planctomycetes bacterium]|nr:hypothetical protein [Planctomycetota bacterium]
MDLISNNNGRLAASDSSGLTTTLRDRYRRHAFCLLKHLKSIFIIMDTPAEIVLQELAARPISHKRIQGLNWVDIDEELECLIRPLRSEDARDLELIKIIELGLIDGLDNQDEWLKQAADLLATSIVNVTRRMNDMRYRRPTWNRELGSMVFCR